MGSEKKNINIWKTLQKVPAGTMFVPLIIGALITTLTEGVFHFDLWATLGNPMKDMFSSSGQMLLIGLMLFCTGTSLRLGDLKDALHRGVLLILVRLGVAYALSALFFLAFGYDGVFGISFLAFVCAVTSANAALYMGIIQPFGDKADKASFGVMLICSMPLLPLLFLGFFGTSGFGVAQVEQIISLLIPFVLGMLLGNLDADIRKVFAGGNAIILPFLYLLRRGCGNNFLLVLHVAVVVVGVLFVTDFKVKKPQNPMVILLVALVALALSMMFHLL